MEFVILFSIQHFFGHNNNNSKTIFSLGGIILEKNDFVCVCRKLSYVGKIIYIFFNIVGFMMIDLLYFFMIKTNIKKEQVSTTRIK